MDAMFLTSSSEEESGGIVPKSAIELPLGPRFVDVQLCCIDCRQFFIVKTDKDFLIPVSRA